MRSNVLLTLLEWSTFRLINLSRAVLLVAPLNRFILTKIGNEVRTV